tara:strand:- start:2038 stop:3180 length:1143 start_codon:yes stop_codon:yes gene_type:complete
MAKKNVLAYNSTANRLEVPPTGDEYQFVRNVELTEGCNLTMTGSSNLILNGSAKIQLAPGSGSGGGIITGKTGAPTVMAWDTAIRIDAGIKIGPEYPLFDPYLCTAGMTKTICDATTGKTQWDYQYQEYTVAVELDVATYDTANPNYNYAMPFSFRVPNQKSFRQSYDTVAITEWGDTNNGFGETGYYAAGTNLPLRPTHADILTFSGRFMGIQVSNDWGADTISNMVIHIERAKRPDTAGPHRLRWQSIDSIALSPFGKGLNIAQDFITTNGDTAGTRTYAPWGETGEEVRSLWGDSLRDNYFAAGDTVRFLLHLDSTNKTLANRAPTFYITTKWGQQTRAMHSGGHVTQAYYGMYDKSRYLGYWYLNGADSNSPIGGY